MFRPFRFLIFNPLLLQTDLRLMGCYTKTANNTCMARTGSDAVRSYLAACLHFELRLMVVVWMYVCMLGSGALADVFLHVASIHPPLPLQHIQDFESAACCRCLFACLALPRQNKKRCCLTQESIRQDEARLPYLTTSFVIYRTP